MEFALILPVIVLILFATVEFGRAFWTYQQVSAAASEGARRAAVSRNAPNRAATINDAVRNASPNLQASSLSIDATSTWSPGAPVTVNVSYELDSVGIGLLTSLGFDGTLDSSRVARVEQ
ncbi:MAG: hypothetical protein JWO69_1763 [Thermoleophilia bacterium]|nr:hypothetical protein [Thermoleophilia bacterium]